MGNSISAPPPIKIIIHHPILDEPIVTTISDPSETYSSFAQRIIETDFYSHCNLLPLLQFIHPTKLSAYQLLFGGNRAIIVKPCWTTQEDEACLDVNVSLRLRQANEMYEAPASPNSSILYTLPDKYAPNQEGRRPTLELDMVCTKIRQFGSLGPYLRVDDSLTKLIQCEPHPEGQGYIHTKIIDWDEHDEDCTIPERWICQFDSDEEEGPISNIASRVEIVDTGRALTGEATRDVPSEAPTKQSERTRKNGVARKNKVKSQASGSQTKSDVPRESNIPVGKATEEVDTSKEHSESHAKSSTERTTSADPKLSTSQTESTTSREQILEAARAIAEDETNNKPSQLQISKKTAKKKTTDLKVSHPKENASTEDIAVEAEAKAIDETTKGSSDVQPKKKSTKKKHAESKVTAAQTKNIASREEIIDAAKAISEEEKITKSWGRQPSETVAKKKTAEAKSTVSQSKKVATREEIIEAAKVIAEGEASHESIDAETSKNMAKTRNVDMKASGSETQNIASRKEIKKAGKAIAHESAKDIEINGRFHEDGNVPSKTPMAHKDYETQAKDAAKDKISNSNVGESRSKAKGRKKNGTKRALEEDAASARINGNDSEVVDSSGSPSKTKSGKTETRVPTKTAAEKAKTRVRSESVSNDSHCNLKSVKKQKLDVGLSSPSSSTKIKSGKKVKVGSATNEAASTTRGQLEGKDKPTSKKGSQSTNPLQTEKTTDSSVIIAAPEVAPDKNDGLTNIAVIAENDSRKNKISPHKPAKTSSQDDTSARSPKSPKKMITHLEHSPHRQSLSSQNQSSLDAKNVPPHESFEENRSSKPSTLHEKDAGIPAEPLEGFPEGWVQRRFPRSNASVTKHKGDVYFYTPKMNIKLRSKTQAKDLLAKLAETGGDEGLAWQMIRSGKGNADSTENKNKKRKRTSTGGKIPNNEIDINKDVNSHVIANTLEEVALPPKKKTKSGKNKGTNNGSSKRKADKDPDKPKQPQNSFLLYANSVRSKVAAENPSLNGHEVITKISQTWQSLESAKKKYFIKKAETDLERYKTAMEEYNKHKANAAICD